MDAPRAEGSVAVRLKETIAVVSNKKENFDLREKAAGGETCRASGGSCVPNNYICSGGSYTMDCASGNKCGYGSCTTPCTPNCGCAGVCKNISGTITTPLGQTECTAGTKLCSGNNLKICSNSGTWGLTTCANGCENNACKPAPAKPDQFANLPGLGTYGLAGNSSIPLPQSAITSSQGFQQYAGAVVGGMASGLAVSGAVVGGAAVASVGGPGVAYLMAQNAIAGSSTLQTAAAVATLSQFPASIIACQTQGTDSPACQYGAMGITTGFFADPIGTLQGLQASAQQVQSVAQAGLSNLQTNTSNLFNPFSDWDNFSLTNAPSMKGQLLETYGEQTLLPPNNLTVIGNDALTGSTFADDALISVVNTQYISGGGTQRLIIDPINDQYLNDYLMKSKSYINTQRTSLGMSRVPLAQKFVTQTFPGYSGANVPENIIQQTMATQQSIYQQGGGVANLGDFINCQAGVCREQALILHNVLANSGKSSEVVTGYLGVGGKHAWVEFIDSVTGQRMVADSVWDFVLPVEEAYQTYGGVLNILRQVFVKP